MSVQSGLRGLCIFKPSCPIVFFVFFWRIYSTLWFTWNAHRDSCGRVVGCDLLSFILSALELPYDVFSVRLQARQSVHSSIDEWQHQCVSFSNSSHISVNCVFSLFRLSECNCNYLVNHFPSFGKLTPSLWASVHCHWGDILSAHNVLF